MEGTLSEVERSKRLFLSIFSVLVIFGLLMVFSSSYIFAKENYQNANYFIIRQMIYVCIGIILAWFCSKTKLSFWIRYSLQINFLFTFLLALTFVPGLGPSVKGAHRWLAIGGLSIQPGEFVKYSVILFSIYFFENYSKFTPVEKVKNLICLFSPLVLLIGQPDFGTFSIVFIILAFVCFMSSFPRQYFYSMVLMGLVSGIILLFSAPYRVKRLLTFLDPWKNPKTSGFQIIQSYLAFANGSLFGQGLGNSNEKLFYLPEAHNDFIFSVVGEELGLIGVGLVIVLYLSLVYFGLRVAINLKSKTGTLVVATVVFSLGLQALVNMSVVLGLLPTKGLNLPLISYGGSSILANFFGLSLILSAVRQSNYLITANPENEFLSGRPQFKFGNISNF